MRIFIATPIAGFDNETQMLEYKKSLVPFFNTLKQYHSIYAEIERINNGDDYDSPEYSATHDFGLIKAYEAFVLHYPQKIATSALIELGYAVALHKRIIIVVDNLNDLPFLGQGLEKAYPNVSIIIQKNLDLECAQKINNIL